MEAVEVVEVVASELAALALVVEGLANRCQMSPCRVLLNLHEENTA